MTPQDYPSKINEITLVRPWIYLENPTWFKLKILIWSPLLLPKISWKTLLSGWPRFPWKVKSHFWYPHIILKILIWSPLLLLKIYWKAVISILTSTRSTVNNNRKNRILLSPKLFSKNIPLRSFFAFLRFLYEINSLLCLTEIL